MKKLWAWIGAAFSIVLGLFLFERSKRQNAEAQLSNAEYKKDDAVLQEKQKQSESSLAKEKQKIQEKKDQHAQDSKDDTKDLTPEQVEEYWKNRRSPK